MIAVLILILMEYSQTSIMLLLNSKNSVLILILMEYSQTNFKESQPGSLHAS